MTVCEICGFDDEKPIGRCLEDTREDMTVLVELNSNGLRGILCEKDHIRRAVV